MGTIGDRFNTTNVHPHTPLAEVKELLTDAEQTLSDLFDASKPEVTSALQHFELALHVLAGMPEANEPASQNTVPPKGPVDANTAGGAGAVEDTGDTPDTELPAQSSRR
jgi:hypothetical protein